MSENIGNLNLYEGGPLDHLSKEEKERVINLNNGGLGVVIDETKAMHVETGEIVNITKEEYERYSRDLPKKEEAVDASNEDSDHDNNYLNQQRA